eukprot:g3014.t1
MVAASAAYVDEKTSPSFATTTEAIVTKPPTTSPSFATTTEAYVTKPPSIESTTAAASQKAHVVLLPDFGFFHAICKVRENVLSTLEQDGFINVNMQIRKWFHRKYSACYYDSDNFEEKGEFYNKVGVQKLPAWNQETSGKFKLVNDVTTNATIYVSGILQITGIVRRNEAKPAIDGGGKTGCVGGKCPGHTVFILYSYNQWGGPELRLNLTNITIRNGRSPGIHSGNGGGFYIADGETGVVVTLIECVISHNTAGDGGGFYITQNAASVYVRLLNCIISYNHATEGSGGGLSINNGNVIIVSSHFINNTASNEGVSILTISKILVVNSTFQPHNSISGTLESCSQGICQKAISSLPNYGIGCAKKKANEGIECCACLPGKYLPKLSPNSACLSCLPGFATNRYGSATCKACPAGEYAPYEGAKKCISKFAPLLKVSSNPKNKYKLDLEWELPPHFNATSNKLLLVVEPIDSLTLKIDANAVIKVLANTGNATTGILAHRIVDRVYQIRIYLQNAMNKTVTDKLTYTKSWLTTFSCRDSNFYLNTNDLYMENWNCARCPSVGASCEGLITWSGIKPKFGFWQDTDQRENQRNSFYTCLRPQSCHGAKNDALVARFPILANENNMTVGCAEQFSGRLCATCRNGYARGSKIGSCTKCKEPKNFFILIGAIILAAIGTIILIRITVFKPREVHLSDGVKKIVLSYLQLASLAAHANVPWTSSFQQLFTFQQQSTSIADAFLSLDCVLDYMKSWDVFVIKLFGMLLIPMVIVPFAYCGIHCCRKIWPNDGHWKDQFVASVVLLWYLAFPSIVQKLAMLIRCTSRINGVRYAVVDPRVPCFVGEHSSVFWTSGFPGFVIYVIGLPSVGVYTLKHADRLSPDTQLRYGILYDGYSEKYWYWEVVVVLRKIAIILIGGFMDGQAQILAMQLVLFFVLFVTAICQPFSHTHLLHLELLSLAVCFVTFWIGSMFLAESAECYNGSLIGCTIAACIIIGINIVAALILGGIFLRAKLREKKDVVEKIWNSTLIGCFRFYFAILINKIKKCLCGEDSPRHNSVFELLHGPNEEYERI